MRYYTYKRTALAIKKAWQKLRFREGRGYWLSGTPPFVSPSLTMYDAVTVSNIPRSAQAVAGYVNGKWPTFATLKKLFPKAYKLSIAVSSHADADCLDIEKYDATNEVAPAWVKRQQARGVKKPVVYTSLSNVRALLRALAAAGIHRTDVRLWTAHYTNFEHLCGPECGFDMNTRADATQWTSHALGRSLDRSLVRAGFFDRTAI